MQLRIFIKRRNLFHWIVVLIFLGMIWMNFSSAHASEEPPPSEGWIAYIGEDGNVWLIHPDGTGEKQVTDDVSDENIYAQPNWAPDGKKLAYLQIDIKNDTTNLIIVDIQLFQIVSQISRIGNGYDWSPDGTKIIYGTNAGKLDDGIWVYDLQTDEHDIVVNPSEKMVPACSEYGCTDEPVQLEYYLSNPSWSPTGNYISYKKNTHFEIGEWEDFEITDVSTGETLPLEGQNKNFPCDWHPIEDRLVCTNRVDDGTEMELIIGFYNPQGKLELSYSLPKGVYAVGPMRMSNHSDLITLRTLATGENKFELIFLISSSGIEKETTQGMLGSWSPDDEWFFIWRGSGFYIVSAMNEEEFFIASPKNRFLGWSPDSEWLLFKDEVSIVIISAKTEENRFLVNGQNAIWQPKIIDAPPDAVDDLRIQPDDQSEALGAIRLKWTEPDIGSQSEPPINEYEIRFSDQKITEENWGQANVISVQPEPNQPSTDIHWTITDERLVLGETWYFALKSRKENSDWSALSNVPSFIDSGFRSKPDGYSFPNGPGGLPENTGWEYYPSSPSNEDFTLSDIIDMFGEEKVCLPVPYPGQDCLFKPGISTLHRIINFQTWNGHCFGMAVTSLKLFNEPFRVNELKPGADRIFDDISLEDARKFITFHHAMQLANPILQDTLAQRLVSTPASTLNRIYQGLLNDDPVILIFRPNIETGGHAVTPFMLSENGHGTWLVYFYDNNVQEITKVIRINPENNTWYDGSQTWDSESHSLYATPLSFFTGELDPPALEDVLAFGFTENLLLISNEIGQQIGHVNDLFVNEIPGASMSSMLGGIRPADPFFILPPDQTYSFEITRQETEHLSDIDFSLLGSEYAITIENLDLSPTSQDTLRISSDGKHLIYQASETREAYFLLEFEGELDSYRFHVKSVDIHAQESVSLQYDTTKQNLFVNHAKAGDGNYDLVISRINYNGEQVFNHANIDISNGDIHVFDLAKWDGSGELPLLIDQDSDGQYDEEIMLSSQANQNTSEKAVISEKPATSFHESLWFGPTLFSIGLIIFSIGLIGFIKSRKS